MQVTGGALRVRRCGEDGALVFVQGLEPGGDIGGVVRTVFERKPEIGAQERSAQLGDQLFLRVTGIAKALLVEGTIKAAGMVRAVDALMRERRVVVMARKEGSELRHLDVVRRHAVVGGIAAVRQLRAGGGEEVLGAFDRLIRVRMDVRQGVEMRRQTVDLLNVENGIALQERDRDLGILAGGFIGLGTRERVGADDG